MEFIFNFGFKYIGMIISGHHCFHGDWDNLLGQCWDDIHIAMLQWDSVGPILGPKTVQNDYFIDENII